MAKTASFSKAAEHLHVTHSAVSQSIKLLEQSLNTKLFERNKNRVQLTAAGKEYFIPIEKALLEIQTATLSQRTHRNRTLMIHASSTFAINWLIPRLINFNSQHPVIKWEIKTSDHFVDFSVDSADISILQGEERDWAGLNSQELLKNELILVGVPSLQLKKEG